MAIQRSLLTMFCGGGLALAQFNMTASQFGDQVTPTFMPTNQAAMDAITGRPYSATLTSERTAPDGTRMIQPARRVYRDSQGRTRIFAGRQDGFSPRHLILLAHQFNVSEEALCRRLEELLRSTSAEAPASYLRALSESSTIPYPSGTRNRAASGSPRADRGWQDVHADARGA